MRKLKIKSKEIVYSMKKNTLLIISSLLLFTALCITACKSKDLSKENSKKTDKEEMSKLPKGDRPPMRNSDDMGMPPDFDQNGRPGMPPNSQEDFESDFETGSFAKGGPGRGPGKGGKGGPGGKPGQEGPGEMRNSVFETKCSDPDAKSITYSFTNARGVKVTYHAKYLIDGQNVTYSAEDFEDGKVSVTAANEIAFLVINGGSLTLNNVTIEKTGDADEKSLNQDAYNFYGINNALVAVGKDSKMTLNGVKITTNALHANAVFATDNACINVTNGITINNSKRGSRGFFASYKGSVTSNDGGVYISTKSNNSAALATDRGGGSITVLGKNNILKTQANDSPCIYSTGDIIASGITGIALTAQTVVIEGLNNVKITDSEFTGARKGQGAIMIYQSFSGDSSIGQGKLQIENCVFHNQYADDKEAMFYVTNTHAVVTVKDCTFYAGINDKEYTNENYFVVCEENESQHWGKTGTNGGQMSMTITSSNAKGLLKAAEKDSSISVEGDTKELSKDKASIGKIEII